MNRDELQRRLQDAGIRADVYQLGGGLPNERLVLSKDGDHWLVYYSERGERTGLRRFVDEGEANDYFFDTLDRMSEAHERVPTFESASESLDSSQVLGSLRVRPLYRQVVVECDGASDLPTPETGNERVVATSESILLATRGDADGDVVIEVRDGSHDIIGELVWEGVLSCEMPRLVFGSPIGSQLDSVNLKRSGPVPLRIYVHPADAPSRVTVVLTSGE